MKKLYPLISFIILTIFLLETISPVYALNLFGGIDTENFDMGYNIESTLPRLNEILGLQGLKDLATTTTISQLFDPVPVTGTITGSCLIGLAEDEIAFVQGYIDQINQALEMLRLLNIDLMVILNLPVISLDFMARINFWLTKIILILLFAADLTTHGLFQDYLDGRIQCLANSKITPRATPPASRTP